MTVGGATAATVSYDPSSGLATSYAYPSGQGDTGNATAATVGYDAAGRLASTPVTGPGEAAVTADAVFRSAEGRVTNETIDGVDQSPSIPDFFYDGAGRLTAAAVAGHHLLYTYGTNSSCPQGSLAAAGANSDRTALSDTPSGSSAVTTTYCYGIADQLVSASDPALGAPSYDSHGNALGVGADTFSYDASDPQHRGFVERGWGGDVEHVHP